MLWKVMKYGRNLIFKLIFLNNGKNTSLILSGVFNCSMRSIDEQEESDDEIRELKEKLR